MPVPGLSLLGLKCIRGFVSILRYINPTIIIILDILKNCDVKLCYLSNHSMVQLKLILNHFIPGLWKFNNSLLSIHGNMDFINKIIFKDKLKYAFPVYDLNYLTKTSNKIEITTDETFILETLFFHT